jgi:hypothetical protein
MEKQKMIKRLSILLIGIAVFLSACGPQGTPTMSPGDIQNTAVAAAFTMVAQTQAAIPTNTPIPPTETPTETPLPTDTPIPSPTLEQFLIPTATQAAAVDPDSCVKPLNIAEAGELKRVRLENMTTATVNLSLNLYVKNAFGQCGAVSYVVAKNAKTQVINIPVGLWFAYGWLTYPDGDTSTSSGSFEINQGYGDLISLKIGPEVIVAK